MRRTAAVVFTVGVCLALPSRASVRELTLDERILAQTAIERVFWAHRIWPAENPAPKPALEEVITPEQLRARVLDYIRKSNELEARWGQPISADLLQAEMRRMATETQAPDVLRELFAALGDDPFLIAETLARQTLADRLVRDAYASDPDLHDGVRRRARTGAATVMRPGQMRQLDAEYRETTFRVRPTDPVVGGRGSDAILLDAAEFQRLAGELPSTPVGTLREDRDAFRLTAVLRRGARQITTATATWEKTPFDRWWRDVSGSIDGMLVAAPGTYAPVAIDVPAACAPDTWSPFPAPTVRFPDAGHSAVWTGTEMIVWGIEYVSGSGKGARFNPATSSWSAVFDQINAPLPRTGHTMLWTGREIIIWGGLRYGGPLLGDGRRYDPTTDTWRIMSGVAIANREWHTSVWTGTEMIVWGGQAGSPGLEILDDGARYEPVFDAWFPMSSSEAPPGRKQHLAVWSGTEMVIWSGQYSNGNRIDGGRYNPGTDSWRPMDLLHVPPGRSHATAAWTGTEMIVWGGSGSGGYLDSGGRYNPFTDTWTPTSPHGAPLGRASHAAVWTGHEMIVWGGHQGGSTFTSEGGRYNPGFDSWAPTALTGAPTGTPSITMLWTGREVLVWRVFGGTTGGFSGRYCASLCDGGTTAYEDNDGDGYGDPTTQVGICLPATGFVATGGDCNDADTRIRPGAVETCNDLDDDCSGFVDDGPQDRDADRVADACDNCPDAANQEQADRDADALGDACDPCPESPLNDRDHDGLCEGSDNCPNAANPGQENSDDDGFGDACDNCPLVTSGSQADGDGDDVGDLCDNCPALPNPTQADDDLDGVLCDNCPGVPNADQSDANGDGSGDACQPSITLSEVRRRGDRTLRVTARATDPQGDALSGSIAAISVVSHDVVLQDLGYTGDCALGYAPDGIPGDGIGYAWGSVGEPLLFDLDALVGCDDTSQDYRIALGACGDPGIAFSSLLRLDGVPLPAIGCVQGVGATGGHLMEIRSVTPEAAELSFPEVSEALHVDFDRWIIRRVPLAGLVTGKAYRLVVTATDGTTLPVSATADFVYDGETHLLINTTSATLSIAAPGEPVECSGPSGGVVQLQGSASVEGDPASEGDVADLQFAWYEDYDTPAQALLGAGLSLDVTLPLGEHAITFVARDAEGGESFAGALVSVVDTQAPTLAPGASPSALWPPNGALVPVRVTFLAADVCDPSPHVDFVSVASSEPEPGQGNGEVLSIDAGGASILLRATRRGAETGRTYTLSFVAMDASGNARGGSAVVTVPHDRSPGPSQREGPVAGEE